MMDKARKISPIRTLSARIQRIFLKTANYYFDSDDHALYTVRSLH